MHVQTGYLGVHCVCEMGELSGNHGNEQLSMVKVIETFKVKMS